MAKREVLTAVGVTCGIGSMLCGARQAGFKVLGNVEWRKYYHARDELGRNTFEENYPGALLKHRFEDMSHEEIRRLMRADIVLGHPECGHFSQLSSMNADQTSDPADIPLFVDLVAKLQPKFFVMDDLPRSFIAFPMSEYSARLPGYDLFPEWVSNWGYGNIQKNRNRMFMLGAQKAQGWSFRPGETENLLTMEDVLGDLGGPGAGNYLPNHDRHTLTAKCGRAKHLVTLGRDREATYGDLKKFFDSVPNGTTLKYVASDGKTIKHKPSHSAAYWGAHAHVLDGGSVQVHPVRHTPYTIRERARIQGFPDDFIFYGTKFDGRGEWDHEKNNHLVKQTGKAMPVQFCRYVSSLVHDHLVGQPVESSGRRVIPPNNYVSAAKTWYCENIGYADQARACGDCWLARGCSIRWAKYRVGPKPVGAPRPAPAARESTPRRRGAARGTRFAELPPGREKEIKL